MSLIAHLKAAPGTRPTSSRYTSLNGLFYMATGLLLMAWPGSVQALLRDPEFVGHEAALVRVLGMTVAIIGWLYFFGGRSGGRQVVAATVLDRIVLVPLILIPTAMSGVLPHTLWMFAILDPVLGLVGWYLLAHERREGMHVEDPR